MYKLKETLCPNLSCSLKKASVAWLDGLKPSSFAKPLAPFARNFITITKSNPEERGLKWIVK